MKTIVWAVLFVIFVAGCADDDGRLSSVVETFDIGDVVRTPDERFAGLADFPFEPNYLRAGPVRIHYLDEGPSDGDPVVLLHGEPSWSYLYRHMIPILVDAGHRVVVPDLIGFGRSDKPVDRADYTYRRHIDWMRFLLEESLDLQDVTMFLQDWGGLIGLRLVAEDPDRYARVVVANTFLPTGDTPGNEAFQAFVNFVATVPVLPIGGILQGGSLTQLSAQEVAAYDAPFPTEEFKAGARAFPQLVPTTPDDPEAAANRAAWETLRQFDKPFLTLFSDGDPVTAGGELIFQSSVPGAAGQPHSTVRGGHFLQEDSAFELAERMVTFVSMGR